jgi:hypothetical protein
MLGEGGEGDGMEVSNPLMGLSGGGACPGAARQVSMALTWLLRARQFAVWWPPCPVTTPVVTLRSALSTHPLETYVPRM